MRKLATIRKISKIEPIPGKDRVEMAHIDGWTAMISKADNFKTDDEVIFCEEDSVFPKEEKWSFLEKYNYRIKIQRFKSDDGYIYSQGLVLPINVIDKNNKLKLGDDVTEKLGITQYEPDMDVERIQNQHNGSFMMKFKWYRNIVLNRKKRHTVPFPIEVSKTDEERIQNYITTGFKTLTSEDNEPVIQDTDVFIGTEKIDGQSGTFFMKRKKKFGLFNSYEYNVFSRNLCNNNKNSSYQKVSAKYEIEKVLKSYIKENKLDWACIQGECVGTNIQGNKYHVKEFDLYVFNLIDNKNGRFNTLDMTKIVTGYGMKCVPVVVRTNFDGCTVNDILKLSNGKSVLYDTPREGIVFRNQQGKRSFKAVSPEFLFKYIK